MRYYKIKQLDGFLPPEDIMCEVDDDLIDLIDLFGPEIAAALHTSRRGYTFTYDLHSPARSGPTDPPFSKPESVLYWLNSGWSVLIEGDLGRLRADVRTLEMYHKYLAGEHDDNREIEDAADTRACLAHTAQPVESSG